MCQLASETLGTQTVVRHNYCTHTHIHTWNRSMDREVHCCYCYASARLIAVCLLFLRAVAFSAFTQQMWPLLRNSQFLCSEIWSKKDRSCAVNITHPFGKTSRTHSQSTKCLLESTLEEAQLSSPTTPPSASAFSSLSLRQMFVVFL